MSTAPEYLVLELCPHISERKVPRNSCRISEEISKNKSYAHKKWLSNKWLSLQIKNYSQRFFFPLKFPHVLGVHWKTKSIIHLTSFSDGHCCFGNECNATSQIWIRDYFSKIFPMEKQMTGYFTWRRQFSTKLFSGKFYYTVEWNIT